MFIHSIRLRHRFSFFLYALYTQQWRNSNSKLWLRAHAPLNDIQVDVRYTYGTLLYISVSSAAAYVLLAFRSSLLRSRFGQCKPERQERKASRRKSVEAVRLYWRIIYNCTRARQCNPTPSA